MKGPGARGWRIWAGLAVALLSAPSSAQEPPALDAVLARAGAYIVGFQRQLSGVVAEEQYVQDSALVLPTSS